MYARWVPPSKSAAKPKPASPEPAPISTPTHAPAAVSQASDRKAKKLKRTSIGQAQERQVDEEPDTVSRGPPTPQVAPDSATPSKKRKRRSAGEDEAEAVEVAPKKAHKAVLSKFEKATRRAEAVHGAAGQGAEQEEEPEQPPEELHDLVPIPQPAPVPDAPFVPTYSANPTWLARPLIVPSSKTVPFSDFGIHPSFLKTLEKQGFTEALAVQSALLPMLRPGLDQHLGDICVSARTGSGKTLAYLFPIIEALRDQPTTTLSAVVVVPTRQLVDQALKVAEELCVGTKLKVGTALGNVPFAVEQRSLVKIKAQYDPERAKELHEKAARQLSAAVTGRGGIFNHLADMPEDHIPQYYSRVDILICTPGRLVEHIDSTTGFLLRSVKWLVIDEADQLLTHNFQGWASVLMDALHTETPEDFQNSQERLRKQRQSSNWSFALPNCRRITKVVLSATMRKDLTKLGTLRLKRPKLVVVEESTEAQTVTDGDVFELPSTLAEYAINVRDGSKKPLYLLFILLRHIFTAEPVDESNAGIRPETGPGSVSESDACSDSDPDSESDESDSDTDSDSDSVTSSSSSSSVTSSDGEDTRLVEKPRSTIENDPSRVLIFAKSNENASRLAHLISVLEPSLQPFMKTMTPSATAKQTQKLLRSFSAGKTKILIASDAASRGLDIPDISHVINYDIPSSITSYVHRVGRTARAGKGGQAMTLVTKSEAGWFWNQIARGGNLTRINKRVVRVELKERDVTWDRKRTYKEALQELQGAVEGA